MPIELICEVTDRSGDKSSTSMKVESGIALGPLTLFAVAWVNLLDDIIAGVIRTVTAYAKGNVAGLTGNSIVATSDVEHYGKFEFLTNSGNNVKVNVPALDEGAVGALTSDDLDIADPQVAAFIAAMTTGIAVTGGTITPCDIAENDLTDLIFAREAFSNSGAHR